jgi:hypothetical protein
MVCDSRLAGDAVLEMGRQPSDHEVEEFGGYLRGPQDRESKRVFLVFGILLEKTEQKVETGAEFACHEDKQELMARSLLGNFGPSPCQIVTDDRDVVDNYNLIGEISGWLFGAHCAEAGFKGCKEDDVRKERGSR